MTFSNAAKMIYHSLLTASFLGLLALSSPVQSEIVSTDTLVNQTQLDHDREQIKAALEREEVRTKLTELGVNPTEVQARVDSLTDAEVQQLAGDIHALPAGGSNNTIVILLLIIIIILLV